MQQWFTEQMISSNGVYFIGAKSKWKLKMQLAFVLNLTKIVFSLLHFFVFFCLFFDWFFNNFICNLWDVCGLQHCLLLRTIKTRKSLLLMWLLFVCVAVSLGVFLFLFLFWNFCFCFFFFFCEYKSEIICKVLNDLKLSANR